MKAHRHDRQQNEALQDRRRLRRARIARKLAYVLDACRDSLEAQGT